MMLSIGRTVVYFWLGSILSGCALTHSFINDTAGKSRPVEDSPIAAEIPMIGSDIASRPEAEPQAGTELSLDGGSRWSAWREEAVEEKKIPREHADAPRGTDTTREEAVAAPRDDLIELWRDDMDKAMQPAAGQTTLSISSDLQEHHRVRYYLDAFCGRLRTFYERALARSGKYRSLMTDILRNHGLPEKLIYLAFIESGFSPYAYSRAHAMGPWQFIRSTALHYGLTINSWVDERRDPALSTRAAAAYLKDLHQRFGEWFLAAAAYNAGEGRVGTALQLSNTNDFWLLRQKPRHLKLETRDYVPKFVAAALIGREPEKYGFEQISYEAPLQYDEVTLHRPLRLQTVAKLANTDLDVIKELNPALLRNFTPPGDNGFTLRLPLESGETFLAAYRQLPASEKIKLSLHKVKQGDTLSRVAKQYGVTVNRLMQENSLKSSLIRPGQELVVVRSEAAKRK